MEKTKKAKLVDLVIAALITAIILIMSFTPLGYFKVGLIEISLLTIPVTIGATLLGPKWGACFGALFGLTSFIQCFGLSAFGVALLAINPIYTFIVCVVPRVLMGFGVGLIFKGIQKLGKSSTASNVAACVVSSFSGAILNTIFFMSALLLCFYQTEYIQNFATQLGTTNVLTFAIAFIGVNVITETLVAFFVTWPVSLAVILSTKRYRI